MLRLVLFLLWAAAATAAETRYEIDLAQAASRTLLISLETECPKAACEFQMPVWNATYQIRDFAQYVSRFEAAKPGGEPLPWRLVAPSRWRVLTAPGERVRLKYHYWADNPGPFGCSASSRHVFLNFAQVLLYPVDRLREPASVRFLNRPRDWKTALELPERDGAFHARHYDELVDAPVELSAFAETQFPLRGRRLRIVVDAEPGDYSLERLRNSAVKIASTATSIMQDVPFPSYTFMYHFREGGGGGMEHANSTAIDSRPCRDCDLAGVTAHEFFHLWNVKRIRPASLEPIDYTRENVTPSLWFSEGVTSTYGSYIQLQAGLDTPAQFLRRLEGQITRHERLPARLMQSAEDSSISAWLERYPAYGRPGRSVSYYLKGELAGYMLDLAIRHFSGNRRSLDDLMRRLNVEYAQKGRFFEDTNALEQLAGELAGRSMKDFFDPIIRRPGPIDWDQYLGYAGYGVAARTEQAPSLGIEISTAPGRIATIVEVQPSGAGAKAGLQTDDRVITVDGQPVRQGLTQALDRRPPTAVHLEIERRGRPLAISVLPEMVPQIRYRIEERPGASAAEKAIRAGWLRAASNPTKSH